MSLQNCSVLVLNKIRNLLLKACVWARGREGPFSLSEHSFLCFSTNLTMQLIHLSGLYSFFSSFGKTVVTPMTLERQGECLYAFHRFKDPHSNSSLIARISFMIHEKNESLLFSFGKCPMECLNLIFFSTIFSEVTLIPRRWYFTIFYTLKAFYVSFVIRLIFQY